MNVSKEIFIILLSVLNLINSSSLEEKKSLKPWNLSRETVPIKKPKIKKIKNKINTF